MQNCPICYNEMEVRECAPCHDCGGEPKELDDFRAGIHTYSTWVIYEGLRLNLCDFCDVDFGSYKSDHFGFKNGKRLSFENFAFVRNIENPQLEYDKYCTTCGHRLKFLKFLEAVRALNV